MEKSQLSKDSTLYVGAKLSMVITILKPGHVLISLYGYNDGELGDAYLAVLDEQIRKNGFICVYMDAREQTGIATEERERLAAWTRATGDKYRAGHLLFKSKLIELAVAVVNLLTGGSVRSYSKLDAFEDAIRSEVPGFSKLPVLNVKAPAKKSA
jgi:hypothetical protein